MKIVKEGEKRRVVCPDCGLTQATYRLRDVSFDDGSGTVENVLAGVCDTCDQVVSLPAQSTSSVKDAYEQRKKPLEVRVPAHYIDILRLAALKVDPLVNSGFHSNLMLYYLHGISSGRLLVRKRLKELLDSESKGCPQSKRLSLKVNQRTMEEVKKLKIAEGFENDGDVFKALVLNINEELLQAEHPAHLQELQTIAATMH